MGNYSIIGGRGSRGGRISYSKDGKCSIGGRISISTGGGGLRCGRILVSIGGRGGRDGMISVSACGQDDTPSRNEIANIATNQIFCNQRLIFIQQMNQTQ